MTIILNNGNQWSLFIVIVALSYNFTPASIAPVGNDGLILTVDHFPAAGSPLTLRFMADADYETAEDNVPEGETQNMAAVTYRTSSVSLSSIETWILK